MRRSDFQAGLTWKAKTELIEGAREADTLKRVICTIALVVCAFSHVLADNWPQWRGPQLNGTAA